MINGNKLCDPNGKQNMLLVTLLPKEGVLEGEAGLKNGELSWMETDKLVMKTQSFGGSG